jgi:hypothetical protein
MTSVSGATRPGTPHLYDSTDSLLRFAMRADATLTGCAGWPSPSSPIRSRR